jgi:pimeloyl-ACP methyl ester carboxylesterase
MVNFVLVHGGAHGAWCWDRLVPRLRENTTTGAVLAVDLCGHGHRLGDRPQGEIRIADYVDSVVEELESADLSDVVLVGHSLAGITLPEVAARCPDRIHRLVYLSTTNPPVGSCVNDSMAHPLSPISRGVDVTEAFCSDLDEETAAWLVGNLGPQPEGVLAESIRRVAGPREIPSTYVLLEKDEVLPPAYQLEQAETIGADEIVRFEAGHSAFASRPTELAELLLSLG